VAGQLHHHLAAAVEGHHAITAAVEAHVADATRHQLEGRTGADILRPP
jgi:hypothetical protein